MKSIKGLRDLDPIELGDSLENAAVLPQQLARPATSKLDGIQKLMAAVLSDATRCFCKMFGFR